MLHSNTAGVYSKYDLFYVLQLDRFKACLQVVARN